MTGGENAVLKHQRGRDGRKLSQWPWWRLPRLVAVLGFSAQVDYVMAECEESEEDALDHSEEIGESGKWAALETDSV
ncbi:hypothetical protein N7535_001157 [Penicillium sp. DV-2018c]|nr:hypothetical protein N7461_005603 [Penicillium sp. DV-2018c]KAJ5582537.1 hypothetical protein N7535_001157 [Penicillium sp. DV-2018c]